MSFPSLLRGVGRSGEKYLVWTRREWRKALKMAGGAGFIASGMVVLKFVILYSRLSWVAQSLLIACNYASSFMLMQGFGFRLATKEPSVLAVVVSRRLKSECPRRKGAAVLRTQLVAVVGNFLWLSASVVAFHFIYRLIGGRDFLTTSEAHHTLESLHPLKSGTLIFAALTGVWLWLASMASAWIALRTRVLRIRLGVRDRSNILARSVRAFSPHVYGVMFNLLFASLLAVTPVVGRLLGLKLDVRHFTLSGGAMVLSLCRLGIEQALHSGLGLAVLSVALICLLNCAVSFVCSFKLSRLRVSGPHTVGYSTS